MNTQGAELLILKGLGIYLDNLKFIHTPVFYKEIYTGQVMYKDLNDFIIGMRFIFNLLHKSKSSQYKNIFLLNSPIFFIIELLINKIAAKQKFIHVSPSIKFLDNLLLISSSSAFLTTPFPYS